MKNKNSKILSKLPLMFEKNIGQHDKDVRFMLKQNKCNTYFTQSNMVLALYNTNDEKSYEINLLSMNLEGSNLSSDIIGEDEFNCKINYFMGSDKDNWTTDIPIYERITYKEVYPGIDLSYYGNEGQVEHDFIVNPGADYNNININYKGADKLELDEEGNLIITLNENKLLMSKPIAYQEIDGNMLDVDSFFEINGENVKFNIPNYNNNEILIIDPILKYSSYLGGGGTAVGYSVAVDDNQCAYITGIAFASPDFPVTDNAYQKVVYGDGYNSYLLKIDTTLNKEASLVYGSYFGSSDGSGSFSGFAIDVYENQYAYITGSANSSDFPITPNKFQEYSGGGSDVYLLKIDTDATDGPSSIAYGTFLGGDNNDDSGFSVVVDSTGNAYLTGNTFSDNFPTTSNAYKSTVQGGIGYAFVSKLDAPTYDENNVIYGQLYYSTFIGGTSYNIAKSIDIDSTGNAYITGQTKAQDYPTSSNAYQSINNSYPSGSNVFLSKLTIPTASDTTGKLPYSTYLGGTGNDIGFGIKVDSNGNAYIAGQTTSSDFFQSEIINGYQTTFLGTSDGFLVKMSTPDESTPNGKLLYGTYICGLNDDINASDNAGLDVTIDQSNLSYVTGLTTSKDFSITENAFQNTLNGTSDAFLIQVDTTLTGENSLLYGTYFGGDGDDGGYGVAIDSNQNVYISGQTTSSDSTFPTTSNAYSQTSFGGSSYNIFLTKFGFKAATANLVLEKYACKCKATPGESMPYTIKIKNYGPDIASNVVITDTIVDGLTIEQVYSSNGPIEEDSNSVVWMIDELEVGGVEVASIIVSADESLCNTYVINSATLTSDSIILNPEYATDKSMVYIECPTTQNECDLVLEKTTCCSNIDVNNSCQCSQKIVTQVPYTINIVNNGPSVANNVVITDILPAIMKYTSSESSIGNISSLNNVVTWNIPTLQVGERAEAVIIGTIYGLNDSQYIKNTAIATSSTPIINQNNCIDTCIIYINYKKAGCGWS